MSRRLLALAATLVTIGSACSPSDDDASPPSTLLAPRPDRYSACPPAGIEPQSPMRLVDRGLPNLGDGMMGRRELYVGIGVQLEIAVGVDVLDAYEDLDFETQDATVGGLPAVVSTAGAFGTADRLVVVTWSEPSLRPPCDVFSLIGTNIAAADLIALAEAPRDIASTTSEP